MLRKYAVLNAGHTASCGSKLPNGWGLFDMHGNVWEWCWDGYEKFDAKSPAVDPTGAPRGPLRVIRGWSWGYIANGARASSRSEFTPEGRSGNVGFRVARGQPSR
jgi:formylglycine-generating enzyme